MQSFVFDTYAILEIIAGNENYSKYINSEISINDFVFAELCYKLINEMGLNSAKHYIDKYAPFIIQLDSEIIQEAMLFRTQHKKQNYSATDCINYIMALRLNMKLLTGDKGFENMENVEYAK